MEEFYKKEYNKWTNFYISCKNGDINYVKFIIEKYKNKNNNIIYYKEGFNYAYENKNKNIVDYMIESLLIPQYIVKECIKKYPNNFLEEDIHKFMEFYKEDNFIYTYI